MSGKVLGIVSFKGGVGKTVSTINLGAALVKQGKRVVVVDGNFLSPCMHIYLGLLNLKTTLKEVIRKEISFKNAIYEHKSGLHMLPTSFYKNVDFEGFRRLINELRENYDYVVIDSGPSYTEEIIAILLVVDDLLFITTPDYPTLASTVRAAKLAHYKNVNIRGVIVNRVKKKRFELSRKDIERTVGLKVISTIPEDNKLVAASAKFLPVVSSRPRAKSSKAFIKLAKRIVEDHSK